MQRNRRQSVPAAQHSRAPGPAATSACPRYPPCALPAQATYDGANRPKCAAACGPGAQRREAAALAPPAPQGPHQPSRLEAPLRPYHNPQPESPAWSWPALVSVSAPPALVLPRKLHRLRKVPRLHRLLLGCAPPKGCAGAWPNPLAPRVRSPQPLLGERHRGARVPTLREPAASSSSASAASSSRPPAAPRPAASRGPGSSPPPCVVAPSAPPRPAEPAGMA